MNFPTCFHAMAKSTRRCRADTVWPAEMCLLLAEVFVIRNGFWWTPEDVMPSQVLVSGDSWSPFRGKGTPRCRGRGCVSAGVHAAAKGSFPFLFHYFAGAEGCTGGARSGYVLKSLH